MKVLILPRAQGPSYSSLLCGGGLSDCWSFLHSGRPGLQALRLVAGSQLGAAFRTAAQTGPTLPLG